LPPLFEERGQATLPDLFYFLVSYSRILVFYSAFLIDFPHYA
jgi:hypothetical protein